MTPQTGDTVCIYHRVSTEDGEQIESSYNRKQPFTFTIDSGRVIRGMNDAIKDMEKGGRLTLVVPAAQAHGEYSSSKHRKVRKTAFYAGARMGQTLTFQGDLGQPVQARVLEDDGDCLIIDMNHPLAGKSLTVEIELVDIIKEHTREPFI